MGVNDTRKKVKKSSDEQLKKKLNYEDKLVEDLNVFFEQLSKDFGVVYKATGKILTLNESYEDELNALLKKNYRSIADDFSTIIQKEIEDNIDFDVYEIIPEAKEALNNKIAIALGAYILTRANDITPKISKTTQDEIIKQTQDYIINQASRGISVTQAQIASEVSKKIKEWGDNHSKTVATTEVQQVAEKSKSVEKDAIKATIVENTQKIKNNPNDYDSEAVKVARTVDVNRGSKKVWVTSGDERVRKSHQVLDSVSIKSDDLFLTGMGSLMQYAGDMENGASLSDVINCRCTVVYKFNNDILKIYTNSIFKRKA